MQYAPLDLEAPPAFKKRDKRAIIISDQNNGQQISDMDSAHLNPIDNKEQESSSSTCCSCCLPQRCLQHSEGQQIHQLVYINTLSFQAMEAEISISEYLSILIGCGVGVYLLTELLPLLILEGCGEIGIRIIGLIALAFFSIPPTCLCSTGFKNNRKLCSFVATFFLILSFIDFLTILYILNISKQAGGSSHWYQLESTCSTSDSMMAFSTTSIILSQICLFVNGIVLSAILRNLTKQIEIRDCAVRKKMVILPHKILNSNFPVFYDQSNFFLHFLFAH